MISGSRNNCNGSASNTKREKADSSKSYASFRTTTCKSVIKDTAGPHPEPRP